MVRANEYGTEGEVVEVFSIDEEAEEVKEGLTEANAKFAKSEERKVYSEYVSAARRKGIYFENEMPYGEDRDADGKIDKEQGGRRGGSPGRGEGRGPGRGERPPRRGEGGGLFDPPPGPGGE